MDNILEIRNLEVSFKKDTKKVYAVNGISLNVGKNESVGIVGESGCGKSVTCKSILSLNSNPIIKGEILFKKSNIIGLNEKELSTIRGRKISMIFQNSGNVLNPMVTIGKQIVEVIRLHQKLSKDAAIKEAIEILTKMDVPDATQKMKEYPYQQSGGINQRIVIAIALACNPELLIADEPTSSLDVTIRNQILQIFKDLKHKLSIIIVSHDLAVIKEIADKIVVMYNGMIMEEGNVDSIFCNPLHPYTKALLASIPFLNMEKIILKGDPPSSLVKHRGCPFAIRCPEIVGDICFSERPTSTRMINNVYCHIYK